MSSPSDLPEVPAESAPAAEQGAQTAARQARQLKVDDSKLTAMYANFCRVTGTPEELIVDFGLNPQPFGANPEPVVVSQRIVVNYFTAKRLLFALQHTIQRHEEVFGVLETDVQKRVRNMPQQQGQRS